MEKNTLKLFLVKCKGVIASVNNNHGIAYVIAKSPSDAYSTLRKYLDEKDFGFKVDRELGEVKLLAECTDYPDCGIRLLFDTKCC